MIVHIDKNVGVTGFKIHWMRSGCGNLFWCRKAISIMGGFNMPFKELLKTSPFDPKFNDNYVEGKGKNKAEALLKMEQDETEVANSLWVV